MHAVTSLPRAGIWGCCSTVWPKISIYLLLTGALNHMLRSQSHVTDACYDRGSICFWLKMFSKGGSYPATVFFSNFSKTFVNEKQETQKIQDLFGKIGYLTEGKMFGRLRIPIFRKQNEENMERQKLARKTRLEILEKKSLDKNGPK